MGKIVSLFFFASFLLVGCYTNHLQVQQKPITKDFLASTWVGSPDPRQKHPPNGESLMVSWDFPAITFQEGLFLKTKIRFWDLSEEDFSDIIESKTGWKEYLFLHNLEEPRGKILAYKVVVQTEKGKQISTWEHPFWIKKIEAEKEN